MWKKDWRRITIEAKNEEMMAPWTKIKNVMAKAEISSDSEILTELKWRGLEKCE